MPVITWESLGVWSREFKRIRLEYWEAMTLVRLSHLRASIEGEKMQAKMRDNKSKT